MNAIVRQLNTSLLTARGRRRLTGHALVVALVMALIALLIALRFLRDRLDADIASSDDEG